MAEKKKFENSLRIMRISLLLSGINTYPTIWCNIIEVFINLYLYYINVVILYTVIFGEIAWLIHGIRIGRSFVDLSLALPLITITILATVKSYNIYINRNIVCDIIDTLKYIHPEESYDSVNRLAVEETKERMDDIDQTNEENEDRITNDSVKILSTVVNLLMTISGSVLVMFCLAPLATMIFEYSTKGETYVLYPFMVEYWFDVHATLLWPVLYLHQVVATIIVCVNLFGSELLFYVICAYIEMHFRILCHRLERITSSMEVKEDLVQGILKHQQLIFLVEQAEMLFSGPALVHIISSSFLICLSAFNITVAEDLKTLCAFFTFLVLSLSQVALLCYFGDKLIKSSTEVNGAVYNCPWYEFDEQTKKVVLIIIMRARKPCKLTASNFAELNLRAFTTILSRSWSYFALLKTIYK